ncbi:MAG TPA: hypothetical protein VG675_18110 [Bryobacteraceae bacterium]|nr:hypothetical protein [Bryobacteraceae bacterium]
MKSKIASLEDSQTQFILLPPAKMRVPSVFRYVEVNQRLYSGLLAEIQRFRGQIYLADGALTRGELTEDGRHAPVIDDRSWHVATLDKDGKVTACLRFLEETPARHFDDLWVRHAAIANCSTWGKRVRESIEQELIRARQQRLTFGEVGGWAIAPDRRWTGDAVKIILATYGLLQLLGGCTGVATATARHASASVLRRIGLAPFRLDGVELEPYYDPQYGCLMELLQFDSRYPNPRYSDWVSAFVAHLATAPVVCPQKHVPLAGMDWLPAAPATAEPRVPGAWISARRAAMRLLTGSPQEAAFSGSF